MAMPDWPISFHWQYVKPQWTVVILLDFNSEQKDETQNDNYEITMYFSVYSLGAILLPQLKHNWRQNMYNPAPT